MSSVAEIVLGSLKKKNKQNSNSAYKFHNYDEKKLSQNKSISNERLNALLGIKDKKKTTVKTTDHYKEERKEKPTSKADLNKRTEKSKSPTQKINHDTPSSQVKKKILTAEEKIKMRRLKEFKNINEIFEELDNRPKSESMPNISVKEFENQNENPHLKKKTYKPTSREEANLFKKIEEINSKRDFEEVKFLGKKKRANITKNSANFEKNFNSKNNENVKKQNTSQAIHYSTLKENSINKDKANFDGNINKITKPLLIPKIPQTTRIQSSSLSNKHNSQTTKVVSNGIKKPTDKQSVKISHSKINPLEEKIKKLKSIPHSKPDSRTDGYYSKADFYDEDDFIVSDEDDNFAYRKHLEKINSKLRRRNEVYDEDLDDDLDEAGFDEIQDEEDQTAKIGDYEDWLEEMREKKLMMKKFKK